MGAFLSAEHQQRHSKIWFRLLFTPLACLRFRLRCLRLPQGTVVLKKRHVVSDYAVAVAVILGCILFLASGDVAVRHHFVLPLFTPSVQSLVDSRVTASPAVRRCARCLAERRWAQSSQR